MEFEKLRTARKAWLDGVLNHKEMIALIRECGKNPRIMLYQGDVLAINQHDKEVLVFPGFADRFCR